MPSFEDWLRASWKDFRRRWTTLMAVLSATGAATLLGVLLPLVPAMLATLAGVGPAWAVWGLAGSASLLAALWLSTWAQVAAVRAAQTDESVGECLTRSWRQTPDFAWLVTLTFLVLGGAFSLLVLPGVAFFVLFFFAPFYEISGEAVGTRALGLSWARVRPRFLETAAKLLAIGLIASAPGWIPYVGWLIAPFWAPIGIVAVARLASDLRAAAPEAAPPPWLPRAVKVLTLVFAGGLGALCVLSLALARSALPVAVSMLGRMAAGGLDEQTGQALIAVLEQKATPAQLDKAYAFVMAQSSSTWNVALSSATFGPLSP